MYRLLQKIRQWCWAPSALQNCHTK